MTLFLYILLSTNLFGQNVAVTDSLLSVLKYQTGIDKVNTLNELAWVYRKSDSQKAVEFAKAAQKISDSFNYLDGTLTSLNRLGAIAIYNKDIEKAEKLYKIILKEEIKRENDYGIGRVYNQLGLISTQKEQFNEALDYTLKAQEKFELLEKPNIVAITSNNIGDLYRRLGDYDKAILYFLKSLEIKEATKNEESIALTLQNIGIFQIELKNYDKALEYLKKSEITFKNLNDNYELAKTYKNIGAAYFNKSELDSAANAYNNSLSLKKELNIEENDADMFHNLGVIYYKKELYEDALVSYENALKIKESGVLYNNIAHVYFQKSDYLEASKYYSKALNETEKSGQRFEKMYTLNYLSSVYSKLKKYPLAMDYNRQYLQLRDRLENEYKQATNLKMNYEEEQNRTKLLKKDNQIAKANLEKKSAENRRKTVFIYSLFAVLILTTLLFFAIIRGNHQKQLAKLAEKNHLIEEQKVEDLLKKQELKSINAMMIGQEEERKRIARDLHDRLGSMLAMVKNHFKSVEVSIDSLKDSNTKLYKKANKLLDEACEEVRKISQDMTSGVLTKFGLTAALEDLKETLEESKQLEVEFISHGINDRLPLKLEIAIYRIIQELISNILKHAKASEISIQLLKGRKGLNIIVEDNGIGFDVNKDYQGMGLKNINSRVDGLYGEFKIDSTLQKGTTTTIDVPIKKDKRYD